MKGILFAKCESRDVEHEDGEGDYRLYNRDSEED